jgi:hypothetical protein
MSTKDHGGPGLLLYPLTSPPNTPTALLIPSLSHISLVHFLATFWVFSLTYVGYLTIQLTLPLTPLPRHLVTQGRSLSLDEQWRTDEAKAGYAACIFCVGGGGREGWKAARCGCSRTGASCPATLQRHAHCGLVFQGISPVSSVGRAPDS